MLVCAKCSRKLDGGFGGAGKPLAKALRKHLKLKNGPKSRAGVVEVKCLGVCPKGAVVVVDSAQLLTDARCAMRACHPRNQDLGRDRGRDRRGCVNG